MPPPNGAHENVVGFLVAQIAVQCSQMGLPFRIPKVVEVVSTAVASSRETRPTHCLTNWRDDYYDKFRDYEDIGIMEYWLVDYAANNSLLIDTLRSKDTLDSADR